MHARKACCDKKIHSDALKWGKAVIPRIMESFRASWTPGHGFLQVRIKGGDGKACQGRLQTKQEGSYQLPQLMADLQMSGISNALFQGISC